MTTEEAIRTLAAHQELSPRQQTVRAADALSHATNAIIYALAWGGVSKNTATFAADQAQLAADLLRSLAERVK